VIAARLGFTKAEERFRDEAASWLEGQLTGAFKDVRGYAVQFDCALADGALT
jgi:hypothetical protein